jgi:hypothetical protein
MNTNMGAFLEYGNGSEKGMGGSTLEPFIWKDCHSLAIGCIINKERLRSKDPMFISEMNTRLMMDFKPILKCVE